MPRQVKIGFDKVPSPPVKTYHQLTDIYGTPLEDSAGNPLVTEEGSSISSFSQANNSLSTFVANRLPKESIPIQEKFGTDSEVSTTLLGVQRAEEQLSLFADVSTYGLDETNWNYYTVGEGKYPREWYNRAHPVFGKRAHADFYEETAEQALYLKSFPTQYRWPDHPAKSTDTFSPTSDYGKYIRFIALGRWLFELWKDVNPVFANNNFLSDCLTIIDTSDVAIPITQTSWTKAPSGGFTEEARFHNILYVSDTNDSVQFAMDQIEKWTLFYIRIRNESDTYPPYETISNPDNTPFKIDSFTNNPIQNVGQYLYIRDYTNANVTRPGGSSTNSSIGVLESRKSFRYQPGRVSGFTFGLRLKNNPASSADKIEWGSANQTDQYMFQVSGTKFNIVRRSTESIPTSVLEDPNGMNLIPATDFQSTNTEVPPSRDNSKPMYTLTIPRDKWNGDPLDGTGPSGYIWRPDNVTMYKIEYSWYGAIGAKFYAYIPIDNDECRWVLLHTFVIENKLEKPCLQNADFKFRYVLYNNVTENLTEPTFIYKYGSSYYIDGGDEGNVTLSSVTSDTRTFTNPGARGSIVAIHPKTKIFNSSTEVYEGTDNNKKIYPLTLSVFSNNSVRIDINRVKVSPDGQHGTKSVSLQAGTRFEKDIQFNVLDRNTIDLKSSSPSTIGHLDKFAKVIGDGFYNTYIDTIFDGANTLDTDQATIKRRSNYGLATSDLGEKLRLVNGTTVDLSAGTDTTDYSAKLVGYRSIVASSTPIRSNRFKIHFLNPQTKDGRHLSYHWADFAIGVTGDAPTVTNDNSLGYLQFGAYDRVYPNDPPQSVIDSGYYFDLNDQLFIEWTNREHVRSVSTRGDLRESEAGDGTRLEQDYRIRGKELPFDGGQGVLGCVQGSVQTLDYPIDGVDAVAIPGGSDFRIVFSGDAFPPVSQRTLNVAEVGANDSPTGYVFTTVPLQTDVSGETKYIAYIKKLSGTAALSDFTGVTAVQAKIVTLEDDNKISSVDNHKDFIVRDVFRFNIQPLYLFVAMKSNARINNIIVEEISATSKTTHVPNFIGHVDDAGATFDTQDQETSNITIVKDALTSHTLAPSNFVGDNSLSGIKYDTQTSNPLADGTRLYSFYVGQNEAVKFGLENIFNIDRAYLTPGLYNNTAIYFNAVPVQANSSVDVQMTVTSKEQ